MNQKRERDCQDVFCVDGARLMKEMEEKGISIRELARRACVSEQTVRNYLDSCPARPWPARTQQFQMVCSALRCVPDDLKSQVIETGTPHAEYGFFADMRFLGDSKTVRSIDGQWLAESIDVEIPGVVTYSERRPWHADLVIRQIGNRFEASGTDKDDDGVFARGALLEDGNWLRFDYWIDNARLREYGTAMAEYKGCGKIIEGIFLGRDCGHSSTGLVIAKLTLTSCCD